MNLLIYFCNLNFVSFDPPYIQTINGSIEIGLPPITPTHSTTQNQNGAFRGVWLSSVT